MLDINRVQSDIRALSSLGVFANISGRPLMSEASSEARSDTVVWCCRLMPVALTTKGFDLKHAAVAVGPRTLRLFIA